MNGKLTDLTVEVESIGILIKVVEKNKSSRQSSVTAEIDLLLGKLSSTHTAAGLPEKILSVKASTTYCFNYFSCPMEM
jgi:hypothetical protein